MKEITNHEENLSTRKFIHELKNSLTVIKGYLELITKKNKQLSIINNEINRTLLFINEFSTYNKINNLNIEEIDLSLLLSEVNDLMAPILKKTNSSININLHKEIYIEADYNKLKQVLINILKNAYESKPTSLIVNIKVINNLNDIKIIIIDNGLGMTKEELSHIYELFYTTKENGTGLGIPYIKEVIELHSGKIKYSSLKNIGTKVIITLPKKSPKTFNKNN
jgi:signal transduction histidine kinase